MGITFENSNLYILIFFWKSNWLSNWNDWQCYGNEVCTYQISRLSVFMSVAAFFQTPLPRHFSLHFLLNPRDPGLCSRTVTRFSLPYCCGGVLFLPLTLSHCQCWRWFQCRSWHECPKMPNPVTVHSFLLKLVAEEMTWSCSWYIRAAESSNSFCPWSCFKVLGGHIE